MRSVAGLTAINTNGSVLKDERASLIRMAFEARLFVGHDFLNEAWARRHPPSGSKGAVGIVAVRARHHAFLDAVFEGHRELHAHIGVALFTERGLGLLEQGANGPGAMNRMATRTCHAVQGMLGASDIRPRECLTVATEAGVQYAFRRKRGERNNRRFSPVIIEVIPPWTMAPLATRALRRFLAESDALEVRILVEGIPDHWMARLASVITDETVGFSACEEGAPAEYC